jgi:hypothetical protein
VTFIVNFINNSKDGKFSSSFDSLMGKVSDTAPFWGQNIRFLRVEVAISQNVTDQHTLVETRQLIEFQHTSLQGRKLKETRNFPLWITKFQC